MCNLLEKLILSGTEIQTSRIGLGTWAIGGWLWGGTDETDSIRTIQSAIDRGISLIDTAPVYGFGRSEEIVGKALSESNYREKALIATKCGLEWDNGNIFRNSTQRRIHKEIEASLKRLQTDCIDLYQIHWPDPLVPFDETARTMEDLLKQGKIRAVGVSNYSPNQMDQFQKAASLHTSQPPYNLLERGIEQDVLPFCHKEGITTLVYGVLCRGLLTGRMNLNTQFKGDDLRKIDPKFQPPSFGHYLKAVKALDQFSKDRYGKSVLELSVRWAMDQPGVSVVLWGARRPQQLDPIEGVMGWSLNQGALSLIDQILEQNIPGSIGPEFMAPPARHG